MPKDTSCSVVGHAQGGAPHRVAYCINLAIEVCFQLADTLRIGADKYRSQAHKYLSLDGHKCLRHTKALGSSVVFPLVFMSRYTGPDIVPRAYRIFPYSQKHTMMNAEPPSFGFFGSSQRYLLR